MPNIDYGLFEGRGGDIYFNATQFIKTFLITEGKYLVKDSVTKQFYEYNQDWGIFMVIDWDEIQSDLMDYFNRIIPNGWSVKYQKEYVPAFHNLIPRVYDFDKKTNILVFSNCCLQLKSKKVLKHNPEWHRTAMIPYEYDVLADCPEFNKYLKDITCNDDALEDTLEELLGYMLFPSNSAHKMVILLGEGANSKSTFMTLMKNMAGRENTSAIPLKDFEKSFTRHALKGKFLNLVPDGEFLKVDTLISGVVKQFITGDEVSAEIKGGETYSYEPNLKIAMALNRLPDNLKDTTVAIKRRLLILPFRADFTNRKMDRNMGKKLVAEMPGIINRALHGLERLKKNDFVFTFEESSNQILDSLFKESNPLHSFVEECIIWQEGSRLTYQEIFADFRKWCQDNDLATPNIENGFSSVFKQILRSKNIPIVLFSSSGKRGIKNIKCTFGTKITIKPNEQ